MAWNMLKRSAPQLVGFGIGLGSFAYIDRYGADPPEVVANNELLMSAHNGLIAARRGFQSLWGVSGEKPGPQVDVDEMLQKAKEAYEMGDLANCAGVLNSIFIGMAGVPIYSVIREVEWLSKAAPNLHEQGALTDLEAVIVLNWICKAGGTNVLLESSPQKTIDLPLNILKGESVSHTDKLLCCCLLTHAVGANAMGLPEKRANKGWFSRMPRNNVVERIMKEDAVVKALLVCLGDALKFPADFVVFCVDSDERHAKKLKEAGFVDAITTLIASYSTLPSDGQPDAPPREPSRPTTDAGSFLHALSALGGIPHTTITSIPDHLQFTDAVFRLIAENPSDPEAVIYGFQTLTGLLDTGNVPMQFLAEKGVVGLVCQSLHTLGGFPEILDYLNAFIYPFITENNVKGHVKDEEVKLLAQTLHALATHGGEDTELADSTLESLLEGEPFDSSEEPAEGDSGKEEQ
eukprot:TRINITY_DN42379_c0_g1_i1.p1 TRINITY_DN42379_c0_g1~~TRINITY_DN42379_c0_g1_i1.p1  ORF type:complete len:462 (+),score=84.04 TRINITY_DN42379_c0_g1_i1:61-1446(+)